MDNERPANFSLEDGYLRVAGACGRAEYLERLAHYHALGKLRVSGLPNGTGERRDIPLLGLIDYRLAFGTDGRGTLAVRKDLAAISLPADDLKPPRGNQWPLSFRAARNLDWQLGGRSRPRQCDARHFEDARGNRHLDGPWREERRGRPCGLIVMLTPDAERDRKTIEPENAGSGCRGRSRAPT
jgi:hypothetical protein